MTNHPFSTMLQKSRVLQNSCESAVPYLHKGYDHYTTFMGILTPYHIDLLFPAIIGVILVFFGGTFMTLIAAVEAYRMVGYTPNEQVYKQIKVDYNQFLEANAKDNIDSDADGVAEVTEVDPQQLATRKTLLFLKTVDPSRLSSFINGLTAGALVAAASIKLPFAKAITLGNALGDISNRLSLLFLIPALSRY